MHGGRNLLTTFQVYTEHRVYEIQRSGLLYLKKQHMEFNIFQCERHMYLAEWRNNTRFQAMYVVWQ
jgi:hypothetical protein